MQPVLVVQFHDGKCQRWQLAWHPDLTVHAALANIGQLAPYAAVACYGVRVDPEVKLRPGDRLELLSPLLLDPKTSRKERVRQARARRRALLADPAAK